MSNTFKNWLKEHKNNPKARKLLWFINKNDLEEILDGDGFYSIYDSLDMEGASRDVVNAFEDLYENYCAD